MAWYLWLARFFSFPFIICWRKSGPIADRKVEGTKTSNVNVTATFQGVLRAQDAFRTNWDWSIKRTHFSSPILNKVLSKDRKWKESYRKSFEVVESKRENNFQWYPPISLRRVHEDHKIIFFRTHVMYAHT